MRRDVIDAWKDYADKEEEELTVEERGPAL
jgi:hypothetical protein